MNSEQDIQIVKYPVNLIDPSPYQSRTHFDAEKLAELSGNVKEHGIIQPLIARESPGADKSRLELIAGERRLRAAKMAGLLTVPVIVRELDNAAAMEIVLIENLQREDLTVSEEARGYQKALELLRPDGSRVYTRESLALKINKTEGHVRDRLKLLLCPEELMQAVEEGVIAISTAMLVGRIPDGKLRKEATKRVLKPQTQEVPLNYEQTQEMIREKFMVSLKKPGFDIEAEGLLPMVLEGGVRIMGGSCVGCPFCLSPEATVRNSAPSGHLANQGVATGNLLCTLPPCFRKKQDEAWKILRRTAEDQNVRVIEGDGARAIFRSYGSGLNHDAEYVQLDEKPDYDEIGRLAYENDKKWKTLLKGTEVEVVIARHPTTGQRVELVGKKAAKVIAMAKLKGKDVAAEIHDQASAEAHRKDQRKDELREQKLERITMHEGLTDLAEAIGRKGMDADQLSYLFQVTLENSGADGFKIIKDWLELKMPKGTAASARDYEADIIKVIGERATTPPQWLGYIVVATLAKTLRWSGLEDEDLVHFWELYGIKKEQLERRAVAILDAGKKEKKVETGPSVESIWLDELLQAEVAPREPNEANVFPRARQFMIGPKGARKDEVEITLALSVNGTWHAGRRLNVGTRFSARPAQAWVAFKSRPEAVWFTLSELQDLFTKEQYEPGEELIDGVMEMMAQRGLAFPDTEPEILEAAPEKSPADMTFEEQVGALIVGTHKMADLIGKTPKKDAPERKAWDAKRVKLTKAVAKAEAEMAAAEKTVTKPAAKNSAKKALTKVKKAA